MLITYDDVFEKWYSAFIFNLTSKLASSDILQYLHVQLLQYKFCPIKIYSKFHFRSLFSKTYPFDSGFPPEI